MAESIRGSSSVANNNAAGSVAWTNPSYAQGEDGSLLATASTVTSTSMTQYLWATNFGFSIPAGATIDGIAVRIKKAASNTRGLDNVVQLLKGGSLAGDNLAAGTAWATPNVADSTYGGATSLWNTTWSVADINATGFGVVLQGKGNHATQSTNLSVDYVEITVTYTPQGSNYTETVNNSVGISDGPAVALGRTRSVEDAVGVVDATDRLLNVLRTIADGLGVVDSATEQTGSAPPAVTELWDVQVTIG